MSTIRFGKHKGKAFHEIPTDYLEWILRADAGDEETRKAAVIEYRRRIQECDHLGDIFSEHVRRSLRQKITDTECVPKNMLWAVQEIIKEGFVHASLKHHPDRGGSSERMRELLSARKWLAEILDLGERS